MEANLDKGPDWYQPAGEPLAASVRRRVDFLNRSFDPATRQTAEVSRWREWDGQGRLLSDRLLPVSAETRAAPGGSAVAFGEVSCVATPEGPLWRLRERDAAGLLVREAVARESRGRFLAVLIPPPGDPP